MKMNAFLVGLFKKMMVKIDKGVLEGYEKKDDPHFHYDHPYVENPEERQHFDLYYAEEGKRKNVLLIDIHGGAYVHGWRKNNYSFAQVFREAGYDVVCADYRFVDPKAGTDVISEIQDLVAMLNEIKSKEKELGIEKDSWAITGDSAGGHFALFLSEVLSNQELREKWGILPEVPTPKCVLLNCPVFDLHASVYEGLTKSGRKRMFGKIILEEGVVESIDPREHLDSLKCPIFVSSCYNDFLKANYFQLVDDCQKKGKECEYLFLETKDKEVIHVHNVNKLQLPESKQVNEAMIAFLDKKA